MAGRKVLQRPLGWEQADRAGRMDREAQGPGCPVRLHVSLSRRSRVFLAGVQVLAVRAPSRGYPFSLIATAPVHRSSGKRASRDVVQPVGS